MTYAENNATNIYEFMSYANTTTNDLLFAMIIFGLYLILMFRLIRNGAKYDEALLFPGLISLVLMLPLVALGFVGGFWLFLPIASIIIALMIRYM